MNKFEELLAELNFYDGSVGILPIIDISEAMKILPEFNISPIEVTNKYILFSVDGQQYKLLNNSEWVIEKTFDIKDIEKDALKILSDLEEDQKGISIFGQLLEGIQNYIRIEKNKKYNTYYIDMYIGNNKIEFNGSIEDVRTNISNWFTTVAI